MGAHEPPLITRISVVAEEIETSAEETLTAGDEETAAALRAASTHLASVADALEESQG